MARANAQTITLGDLPIPTDNGKGHVPADNTPRLYTGESAETIYLSSGRKTLTYWNITAVYSQTVVHETFVQTDTTICPSTSTGAQSSNTVPSASNMQTGCLTMMSQKQNQKTKNVLSRIYLQKELAKCKQFQHWQPIAHGDPYRVVSYKSAAKLLTVADQWNTLVQYFQIDSIGPFMYNEELDNFVNGTRLTSCQGCYPYLQFVLANVICTWYRCDIIQVDLTEIEDKL